MKQIFIIIACFLSISTLNAQSSKFEFGIGGTGQIHYFSPTNDYSFTRQEPRPSVLAGANFFIIYNTESRFQFRINGNLGYKRLSFRGDSTIPPSGRISERSQIFFDSWDVSLLSLYNIPLKDNKVLQPVFGIFTSFSEHSGFSGGLGSSGDISGSNTPFEELPRLIRSELEVSPKVFHAGVNLGLNYRTYLMSRFPIEFIALAYLSPVSLFEAEIGYT